MDQTRAIGRYRIVEELARGGMGVVYRAQDSDGRAVALKLLLAHRATSETSRRRFYAEVKTLAKLRHPHVVPILDAGEERGCPWLALEFVEGESLERRLREGPLPVDEAVRYGAQLAQALAYVHGCGVLHRDLKPGNVLLRGGRALLTDFGLARDADASYSRITRSGVFMGTPGYWAPEQADGRTADVGPHTDVYGFGALLFACLTGRPPIQGTTLTDYLEPGSFARVPPPRKLRREVPGWLDALCMRCLAVEPSERPASADELARELLTGGSGPREPNAQASRRQRAARAERGSRWPLIALGVVSPALFGIAGGAYLLGGQGAEAPAAVEPGGPLETQPEGTLEFGEEEGGESGFGFEGDDPSAEGAAEWEALRSAQIAIEARTGPELVDALVGAGVNVAVHPDLSRGPLRVSVKTKSMQVGSAVDYLADMLEAEWSVYSGVVYVYPKGRAPIPSVPIDARFRDTFARELELEFDDVPLEDAFQFLESLFQLRVQVLAVPGGTSLGDVPITVRGDGVSLEAALALMADQVGARWRVEGDGSVTFLPPR